MDIITIILMVLCFIIGFIFGDFFGLVRKEERKMIETLQDTIKTQNEIIALLEQK